MRILAEVLKLYGMAEVSGPKSNPVLLAILQKHFSSIDDSTTAWCGIMMGEACNRAGLKSAKPSGYPGARNWLKAGTPVDLSAASVGPGFTDVVVFWRDTPNGSKGHVGCYVSQNATHIYVASGNQGNMVNISPYPIARLLGVRRIKEV